MYVGRTAGTEKFVQNTPDHLPITFKLAHRNLAERADKQAENHPKPKPYPVFQPGQEVLTCVQAIPGRGWPQPKTAPTMARTQCHLLKVITSGL